MTQGHDIPETIRAATPEVTAIRRDLHAHPELAMQEHRTADLIARTLEGWGIPVLRGIGGTGVVGVVRNGDGPRAVGLRADIDALPIQERNGFAHRSRHDGRMHACGHDGHTAMLLAAARHLAERRDFDGTVYLIFQPGEERGLGARAMMADGLFETCPMEAIFAAHNWPGMPVGTFGVAPGPVMASCNEFAITVRGKGGHAALPEQSADPVPAACQLALALQTIVARNVTPGEAAVLSVTNIHAGDAIHVIPDEAVLKGTVRTFADAVTDRIEQRMRRLADSICAGFEAEGVLEFVRQCAPTINHAAEAAAAHAALEGFAGAERVQTFTPKMTAEDFSFFLQNKPGCFFAIGNGAGDHRTAGHGDGPCLLHNAAYDFNDDLIPIGGAAWVRIAEHWLRRDARQVLA